MNSIERMFKLLDERGISAYRLSKATGISSGNISEWKKGKVNPSYGALVKIAEYLNVSVEYLEGKTDNPTPDIIEVNPDEVEFALYQEISELTKEQKEEILRYARMVKGYHEKK